MNSVEQDLKVLNSSSSTPSWTTGIPARWRWFCGWESVSARDPQALPFYLESKGRWLLERHGEEPASNALYLEESEHGP